MCGICGVFNQRNSEPIKGELLEKMCDTLRHRGPDDEGIYVNNNIGLGHRRLSIIDLSNHGHQPMSNETGNIYIVFNGEIYNFPELKKELLAKGHLFNSNTDTEVIIHLYEEKGEDCIQALRGMFAFALWDERNKKLLLARDRLGKKPLYYLWDGNRLVFASEIKAILQCDAVKKDIDLEALDDFLSYLYVPSPKSIYKSIRKLPPGHLAVYTPDKFEIRQYWDVNFADLENKNEMYYVEKSDELIKECVKKRLMSDVPLGAFLSGGIDSSAIVAFMSEVSTAPITTLSIGFKENLFNEINFARMVAAQYKTDHYEQFVVPKALDILDTLVWHFDEPFADSSAIPTYYVSKIAKEHVTVVLSGDGGDENFAGYQRRYWFTRTEDFWRRTLPQFIREGVINPLAEIYPKSNRLPQFLRGKAFLRNLSMPLERAHFNTMSVFNGEMKKRLYALEFKRKLNGYDSFSVFKQHFAHAQTSDPVSKVQYVDMKTFLADDILVKVDRMSMANSLETRAPLLDHKLVEFVATIPSHLKLKGRTAKYIFKKCLEKRLPDKILNRKKMGFAVPLGLWLKTDLKPLICEVLFSAKAKKRGYFQYDFIEKMWHQHLTGSQDFTHHLWALLILEMWHRKFIDT